MAGFDSFALVPQVCRVEANGHIDVLLRNPTTGSIGSVSVTSTWFEVKSRHGPRDSPTWELVPPDCRLCAALGLRGVRARRAERKRRVAVAATDGRAERLRGDPRPAGGGPLRGGAGPEGPPRPPGPA